MSETSSLIIRTKSVEVNRMQVGSETCVVSFAPREQASEKIWGRALFRKMNVDAVGFIDHAFSWYLDADWGQITNLLKPILNSYKSVLFYGHSMGGYAALKFSARFSPTHVLAICPQYSVEPEIVGSFDKRRVSLFYTPGVHDGMGIVEDDVSTSAYVMYDRAHTLDRRHFSLINQNAAVTPIICPLSDHRVASILATGRSAQPILEEMLQSSKPDIHKIRQLYRKGRATSCSYLVTKAERYFSRKEYAKALIQAHAAYLLDPHRGEGQGALLVQVSSLIRLGRNKEALECLLPLISVPKDTPEYKRGIRIRDEILTRLSQRPLITVQANRGTFLKANTSPSGNLAENEKKWVSSMAAVEIIDIDIDTGEKDHRIFFTTVNDQFLMQFAARGHWALIKETADTQ